LLQYPEAFIKVVTDPDISPFALDAILGHQDVVNFLRQNRDTLMQNPCINSYLWIKLIEIAPDA
jgi:hypothetical protein